MSSKKDILIINNCPAFYKINLYNEIAKHKNIFVIFLGLSNQVVSGNQFKDKIQFPYILLNDFQVEKRSYFKTFFKILQLVFFYKPKKIIYGGYIEIELLLLSFLYAKKRNILQTESAGESRLSGMVYYLKIILLKRYSKAIVSGQIHAKVLRLMKFKGEIYVSKGVGFVDKKQKTINNEKNDVLSFLYVGRLIQIKNLERLIKIFNELNLPLTIVGEGPLEEDLKKIAKENITFLGFVDNTEIGNVYKQNNVFILGSISEPWGLVMEEALFYGLPILASNRVGSYPELVSEYETGLVFDPLDEESIKEAIKKMCEDYNFHKNNVDSFDFDKKDKDQLNTYLNL